MAGELLRSDDARMPVAISVSVCLEKTGETRTDYLRLTKQQTCFVQTNIRQRVLEPKMDHSNQSLTNSANSPI